MMKKEFKAPIIEIRQLSAADSVMTDGQLGILANSMNAARNGVGMTDKTATEQFNAWQGFTE